MRAHLERPGDMVLLYGPTDDNQSITVNFDNETLALFGASNDAVLVRGHGDAIGYSGGSGLTLTDMGVGTSIVLSGPTHLTVSGWQRDASGVVKLPLEVTAPVLQSDGNGGTLLTTGAGAHVDFVGAIVPASQIVSPAAPISFMPPPAPQPAAVAAPAAATPAPAAPAADPTIVVTGNDQVVALTDAKNTTVIDHGTGTMIELTGACQISVQDFATDRTGQVLFENQGTFAQSVTNDGNGGTLVQVGSASVDFAGVVLDARHQILFAGNGLLSVQSA